MDPKSVNRFLDQLEAMGEAMIGMIPNDGRLMACGERRAYFRAEDDDG